MFTFESPVVSEIAPDVFRFSQFAKGLNLQFNYFLVRDDQPLLFTTGYRATFPDVRKAVTTVIDPTKIRWVSFSHFESDECGALNLWLDAAPQAEPVCGMVSAMVNVGDFANRPPKGMADGTVLDTGKYRFRFVSTAQFPHGWDAGLLFEETRRTLFCSDLFHQDGSVEAVTSVDVRDRVRDAMGKMQAGPLANYVPLTSRTDGIIENLAGLAPQTLAVMHGSSYTGDGAKALRGLGRVVREVLGGL